MKKIKNLLFFILIFMAVFGVFQSDTFFNVKAADTSDSTSNKLTNSFIDDMPITYKGQLLSSDQITFDEKDAKQAYVLANDTITISLFSLNKQYSYVTRYNTGKTTQNGSKIEYVYVDYNYDKFNVHTTTISIPKNSENYDNKTFVYNNKTYYFNILKYSNSKYPQNPSSEDKEYLSIYDAEPETAFTPALVTSLNTEMLTYENTSEGITINIVDAFTLVANESNEPVDFKIKMGSDIYSITFMKTIVRFANAENPIVSFSTYKDFNVDLNDYDYQEKDNWLQKEQTFTKLNFTFLNNTYKYIEDNKLYFNINFNGFIYKYSMYTDDKYLYVNYCDEVKLANAKTDKEKEDSMVNLATKKIVKIKKDFNTGEEYEEVTYENPVDFNTIFELEFKYRGRYEIEIYDETYKKGFDNPNYYKTSFYIKNDAISIDSIFNNIYILSQTIDENNNPIEYIVNGATLNNKVKSTIKNLSKFDVEGLTLADIISKVDVTYTEFGNSDNIPTTTSYTPEEVSTNMLDSNGDLNFFFDQDGVYQIVVYDKELFESVEYNFTIVMRAKSSYTIDDITYKASEPFKTEIQHYDKTISNSDPIRFSVYYNSEEKFTNKKLDISFLNEYTITYGIQLIDIKFETDAKNLVLTITCKGVGNMEVTLTNGTTSKTYNLNSEEKNNTIVISEYGKYNISVVDAMGTTVNGYYNFAKKMNTSTLILIGVSAFIVICISIFIFSVRGKVKTR